MHAWMQQVQTNLFPYMLRHLFVARWSAASQMAEMVLALCIKLGGRNEQAVTICKGLIYWCVPTIACYLWVLLPYIPSIFLRAYVKWQNEDALKYLAIIWFAGTTTLRSICIVPTCSEGAEDILRKLYSGTVHFWVGVHHVCTNVEKMQKDCKCISPLFQVLIW